MLQRFLKCISTLLVLVMLVNMVPAQVFADLQLDGTEQIEIKPTESSAEKVTIVQEIAENRSEYTKEFLLSNGLHLATVYAEPVHYEKDGQWEDIDNTLVTHTDGTYKNTAGVWEVSFPQSFGSAQSISVTKDGYTLSFGMPQKLTTGGNSGAEIMSADATAETFAVSQAATVNAQIDSNAELLAAKAEAEHPETVLENLSSRLTYANVHSNTNVVYDLDSNRVKESIVLAKQDDTLRGYRYTLNVGTMIPVLQDDGSIIFYAPDEETVVMVMPAPYLQDAELEISTDIAVTLTGKDSQYVLTYTLPQDWLAAEERQWPVILDPIIEADLNVNNIKDVAIASNYVYGYGGTILDIGHGVTYGIKRSFLKYENLPPLTSADVVVGATLSMYQLYNRTVSVPAEVHKVTESWQSTTMTWANQPGFDPIVEDFVMGNFVDTYHWDVTDIVQDWYRTGVNNGMMFKTPESVENSTQNWYRQFASSDYGAGYRPTLQIYFRNNNGLESWWDYSSASAGRAGTGYINTYTGNLVWQRSDMGFGGNLMPVTIGYTYNTNDAANNSFGMGYGWRSDFNQLIYRWDEDGDGTIQSDEGYYIWEDGDGTSHYFKYNSDEQAIVNSDGLEMTLTTSSSGDSRYTLKDKNDNTWHFDSQGRLYKIENYQEDSSCITIAYKDATSKLISTVTDGALRKYQFEYGNDTLLDSVTFYGTGTDAITTVTYSYTNENLTGVQYKDGKSASYTYTGSHLLETAKDIDGYQLTYNYAIENSEFAPPCIESVTETDLTNENTTVHGGKLSFQYNHNQTKLQSSYKDENDEEKIESTLYYQFNDLGNTVAIMDDEGRAQYAKFAKNDASDTTAPGNQLKLSSKLQNTVINLLSDSSFEASTNWTAIQSGTSSNSTTEHYLGNKSLQITGGAVRSTGFTAKAEQTYTFSGFVKVSSGTAKIGIGDINGDNAQWSIPTSSSEWTRIQVSYTNNSGADQTVYALFEGTAAYLDCVQVEQMPTASRYNLVNNGDFASSDGWIPKDLVSGTDVITTAPETSPALDSNAYKIAGEHTTAKSVKQTITVSGGEGDSFVFGGWAMGNSASLEVLENGVEKDFSLRCTIHYTDGETQVETVQFNQDVTTWQFVSWAIAATKAYSSITLEAVYKNNANTVYFDGLQLFKEEFGTSYTYDDDGNVISVIDLQNKNTTYEYANNDLTKIIQDGKEKMSYTYDKYHNVETATTEEGYVYTFEYDDYGNNTSVSITEKTENEVKKTITSSATYTSDHNHMATATDALGNVTTYGYNLQTGLLDWVQYPEDTEASRTEYTYDEMYRMATATADLYQGTTDTGFDMSVRYTYTDDLLTAITTPSTTYGFTYGDFSLRKSVKVGTRTLASYTYETGTNRLERLDYGNGDNVEYSYDSQGRLLKETYEDDETVSYAYDNSGNIATVTDSETGVVTTFYYDLLNRNVGYRELGPNLDHSVTNIYDEDNNLASMTEVINGVTKTYSYTYNEDNRLTSMTVDGVTVEYTYDTFGRLSEQETKLGDTVILTEQTGYNDTATTASTQVTSYNGYTYTYDDNGNILSVSDGTNTTTYVYDSQNQLIRENNQSQGYTHTWIYDNAGNILWRKEYAYTTGTLGAAKKTVEYQYNASAWGDMLTAYDGNTISYDGLGNPTRDGIWNYTWKHGRQLVSMSDGTTTWNYTYNADGLRTQRTNGTDTYTYVYSGSQLAMMSKGNDTLHFTYDATGIPLAVKYNGTTYYYKTNLQGDIMAIVDSTGTAVVSYAYNAWGVLLACTGTMADTLGDVNPLTYRGYVYDHETGLYYVSSRYYDPEIGRWINADGFVSTGQDITGYNMFAYCGNNPVNRKDPTGQFWITALIVTAVAVVCTVTLSGCSAQPTSDVGAAKPYVDMPGSDDETSPNCYAYAIGSPVNEQPGGTSGRIPTKWNDVNDVGKSVEADLKAKGHTVRKISGPDAKVYDNEFKIALRVGTQPYAYNPYTGQLYYDYHFMRQTNTGQWAEKHGYGGASILWDAGMTPDTIPWTLGDVPYYDSAIIYYAVGN